MDQLFNFAMSIRLLVGILVALLLVAVVLISTWTGLRVFLFRRTVRKSEEHEHRRKFRPDGTPYPPRGEGICSQCGKVGKEIFHLPDGRRLCLDCYDAAS